MHELIKAIRPTGDTARSTTAALIALLHTSMFTNNVRLLMFDYSWTVGRSTGMHSSSLAISGEHEADSWIRNFCDHRSCRARFGGELLGII